VTTKHLPQPAALLFDLDGTLVDTVSTRLETWLQALGEFEITADRAAVARLIGSDGRRLARTVAERSGSPIDLDEATAIDHRAGQIYDRLNTNPRPLEGAVQLLDELDTRHIPWAIATSSLRAQVKASVDALQLPRRPMIVDGSDVEHAKPAPDLLLSAAQELRVSSERIWYVGDSIWDMEAARAAGMPSVGVTTGFAGADELHATGAWLVIRLLSELVKFL
jgi:HAD superfamily hydrolase (TIGR01509 family)